MGNLLKSNGTENISFISTDNKIHMVNKRFEIDFTKVKSIEDVVAILKSMKLSFHQYSDIWPEQFKELDDRGLLKEIK